MLGGTAQVGLHVLANLLEFGLDTVALSRKLQSLQQRAHSNGATVWWLSPRHFSEMAGNSYSSDVGSFPAPEWMISTGPIWLANEYLERCPKLQRAVCLSTSSVLSKADSDDALERQLIEKILREEDRLIRTCASRDIDLVILRPTLIYGCGRDENISRMAQFIKRFGFLPLAGKAQGLRQPIHVADLAELMVKVAMSEMTGQQTYNVAGGSTLTYREMASYVFHALGKRARLVSLPDSLLASGARVARTLFGMDGLNAQMVLRQNRDLVFDDRPVRQRYGFHPREFRPGPADFELAGEVSRYLPD